MLFRSGLFSAVLAGLLLFTGGVGSIFSGEIKGSFPFRWGPYGSISWPATWFWILFGASVGATLARQRAQNIRRERDRSEFTIAAGELQAAQARLLERTEELEETLRTQPPAKFLVTFSEIYKQVDESTQAALTSAAANGLITVEQGIRHILRGFAILAESFDDPSIDSLYAANLMLFRNATEIPDDERRSLNARIRFKEPETTLFNYTGVLDLVVELSARATDDEARADPDLQPIALGVLRVHRAGTVRQGETQRRARVLPGAPIAFCDRKLSLYNDNSTIRDWCDRYGDFKLEIKDQIDEYFRAVPFKSFVSIPILPTGGRAAGAPIAVLNIHADRTNLLKGEQEPARHFALISQPLQILLARLLEKRETFSRSVPVPAGGELDAGKAWHDGNPKV